MICAYCEVECERLTKDHIIPISMGGSRKSVTNLVLVCHECNHIKGCMMPDHFLKILRYALSGKKAGVRTAKKVEYLIHHKSMAQIAKMFLNFTSIARERYVFKLCKDLKNSRSKL